jgi:hypothetical protein
MADSADYFSRKVEELKRHNQQLEAQFQAAQYDDFDSPADYPEDSSPRSEDEEEEAQEHRYRFEDQYDEEPGQQADEEEVLAQATELQELKEQLDETSES